MITVEFEESETSKQINEEIPTSRRHLKKKLSTAIYSQGRSQLLILRGAKLDRFKYVNLIGGQI
jgi:hypothetical protein